MNNFEEIFRLATSMVKSDDQEERREGVRFLNQLNNQGRRLIKLSKEMGLDTTELELTYKELREFIERI